MRINYLIASWDGDRHGHRAPWYPVLEHLRRLDELDLSAISQVTVGCPRWRGRSEECVSQLKSWRKCGGTPVVVVECRNQALSYGQYSTLFGLYSDFDYYIIAEDDFWPVLADLDLILVGLFRREQILKPGLGYLCGIEHCDIACNSNGIILGSVLREVWAMNGCLPGIGRNRGGSQYIFSRGIRTSGCSIRDYSESYRTILWRHERGLAEEVFGSRRWSGKRNSIWLPAELKDESQIIPATKPLPVPRPFRPMAWEES